MWLYSRDQSSKPKGGVPLSDIKAARVSHTVPDGFDIYTPNRIYHLRIPDKKHRATIKRKSSKLDHVLRTEMSAQRWSERIEEWIQRNSNSGSQTHDPTQDFDDAIQQIDRNLSNVELDSSEGEKRAKAGTVETKKRTPPPSFPPLLQSNSQSLISDWDADDSESDSGEEGGASSNESSSDSSSSESSSGSVLIHSSYSEMTDNFENDLAHTVSILDKMDSEENEPIEQEEKEDTKEGSIEDNVPENNTQQTQQITHEDSSQTPQVVSQSQDTNQSPQKRQSQPPGTISTEALVGAVGVAQATNPNKEEREEKEEEEEEEEKEEKEEEQEEKEEEKEENSEEEKEEEKEEKEEKEEDKHAPEVDEDHRETKTQRKQSISREVVLGSDSDEEQKPEPSPVPHKKRNFHAEETSTSSDMVYFGIGGVVLIGVFYLLYAYAFKAFVILVLLLCVLGVVAVYFDRKIRDFTAKKLK
eukprot:CAMPEP_0174252232 /NCGR_PEP_ID=MMETSP0439-20130205/1792_1 /TAXON_ID=0 /ORGANISM="Stereomyxa ramosa, Strain Chinc5" /LENGTH=471 /DNA_ID=CAMNT_0015332743 /DNA_START=86 /DNA_END=1501 /DNA_ORIENTATION=+